MRAFADLARELNRSPVYLRGLQTRFVRPVLFAGKDMGEDALRVLERYLTALAVMRRHVGDELPHVRAALAFARPLVPRTKLLHSSVNP